jgi:hypothetical protein
MGRPLVALGSASLPGGAPMAEPADTAGWAEHERAQRQAWMRLTPAQRLEWLWQAKQFALEVQRARPEERKPGDGR